LTIELVVLRGQRVLQQTGLLGGPLVKLPVANYQKEIYFLDISYQTSEFTERIIL